MKVDKELVLANKIPITVTWKIFSKSQRKQNLYIILCKGLPFLLLTSLFLVWFCYEDYRFQNYLGKSYNWMYDKKISAYSRFSFKDNPVISEQYLENAINSAQVKINSVIANATSQQYTGILSLQLYLYEVPRYLSYELLTLDKRASVILSDCLITGRMPTSPNEVLYIQPNDSFGDFSINDSIELMGVANQESESQTFTIVGILANVEDALYKEGFSRDILFWENYYLEHPLLSFYGKFITTSELFIAALNNYSVINSNFATVIDFNYDLTVATNARQLSSYLTKLEKLSEQGSYLQFLNYGTSFYLCSDLFNLFVSFKAFWLRETAVVVAVNIPLFFLLIILFLEMLKISKHEIQNASSLMKLQGVDNASLQKVIFLKNFSNSLWSFLVGCLLGMFLGFLISLIFQNVSKLAFYISGLKQLSLLLTLGVFFLVTLFGGILFQNAIVKRTLVNRSEKFAAKRKGLRKLFSSKEVLFLIPGGIALAIGIILQMFYFTEYLNNAFELTSDLLFVEISSCLLVYLGAGLIAVAVFFVISRIIIKFWSLIGSRLWKSWKSVFGLVFRNLATNQNHYRNIAFTLLLFGFGFLPGIVFNTSINHHLDLEADLAVGSSDLAILKWTNDQTSLEIIKTINGVANVTEVCNSQFSRRIVSMSYKIEMHAINVLALKNPSQFAQTVNLPESDDRTYSKEDIEQLQTNMTILMNKKHAKELGYTRGEILFNSGVFQSFQGIVLTNINYFDYFPALPYKMDRLIQTNYVPVSLVTSCKTATVLEDSIARDATISRTWLLLIKLENDVNDTRVKNEIYQKTNLCAVSKADILGDNTYQFKAMYLITCTLLTSVILVVVSFLTAQTIYSQELFTIDFEYQLGATKKQIWSMLTFEFLLVAIIPTIISIIASALFVRFTGFAILHIQQNYKAFTSWTPWWLLILAIFLTLAICLVGWLASIILRIRRYRPSKKG